MRSLRIIAFLLTLPSLASAQTWTYQKTINTGGAGEATYYDSDQSLMGVCAPSGNCLLFNLDGTPAGSYATPTSGFLDAAGFDPVRHRVLFLTQSCVLTEADPMTHTKVASATIGFGASVCAGISLGRDDNLYVASYGSNQVIVVDRTGANLVRKIDLSPLGFSGPDGITTVPGNDNIVVLSSTGSGAVVITPTGTKVSGPSPVGTGAIFVGGPAATTPDDLTGICTNGHVWVCEAYSGKCYDYAPATGVTAGTCGCHETSGAFMCPPGMMCGSTTNNCVPAIDMASPDLSPSPDLSTPPDLAMPDFAAPDSATAAPDLASPPASDLAQLPDLVKPNAGAATPGGCGCRAGGADERSLPSMALALFSALAVLARRRRASTKVRRRSSAARE